MIHPVIHFRAIPDAINTASERRLICHPEQTMQVGRMVRICNALPVDVFRAAGVYSAEKTSQPDELHRCGRVCLITQIHVEKNTHMVKGGILTGTEL